MKDVFASLGYTEVFSKVAIKPGKPTWHFRKGDQSVLGLPGNPASAIVCAHLFLRPLLSFVLGSHPEDLWVTGKLTTGIPENRSHETFLRGTIGNFEDGIMTFTPAYSQDTSLLRPFVSTDVLIHRPAHAPAMDAGNLVQGVRLT